MIHFYFKKRSNGKIYHIDGELIVNECGDFLVYCGNNTYHIDGSRFSLDSISENHYLETDDDVIEEFREINPLI